MFIIYYYYYYYLLIIISSPSTSSLFPFLSLFYLIWSMGVLYDPFTAQNGLHMSPSSLLMRILSNLFHPMPAYDNDDD